MKRLLMGVFLLVVGLILSGCKNMENAPENTGNALGPLQERALTVRNIGEEFGATYDDVWYSTIATLQMNGFILKQADKSSGFIYGVWRDAYERQEQATRGGFLATTLNQSPTYVAGVFSARTGIYKQIDVSVTMERMAQHQTLVRLVSRFDSEGVPVTEGIFANRFFGLLRKEIFLRVNRGSIYHTFSKK